MPYTSTTKSWAACNKDQRREAMAQAVFNGKLSGIEMAAGNFVISVKDDLLRKIKLIRENLEHGYPINQNEMTLLAFQAGVENLTKDVSGLKRLENLMPALGGFDIVQAVEPFTSSEVRTFLTNKEFSRIIEAKKKFRFSGSGSKIPNGKAESSIGIPDSLLEKLLQLTGADALLSSWMQISDERWKKVVDHEVERRKNELEKIKRTDPKNGRINLLKGEIQKLQVYWHL